MKEVEVKGQAFRTMQLAIGELFGSATERRLVGLFDAEFRSALSRGSIVSGGWYPVGWYRQFHEGLVALLPNEERLAYRLGREVTNRDLSGIYRFMLKLTSPALILRHVDKVISSYFRGGEVDCTAEDGYFRIDTRGWYGMTHPVWEACAGGFERLVENAGGRSVTSTFTEICSGSVRGEVRWL
jgi:hypothetical protein